MHAPIIREPNEQDHPLEMKNPTTAYPVRIPKQLVVPPSTAKATLVTTDASGLLTVVSRPFSCKRQLTVVARGIAEVLQQRAFHIIVSNFSDHTVHLPKHRIIAYTEPPPSEIRKCQPDARNILLEEPPRSNENRKTATFLATTNRSTLSTEHYKANDDRTTHMAQHTTICQEDNKRLAQDWRDKVDLSNNHVENRERFPNMLSEF